MNSNVVGRNDTCPCGSGRKYKHCCGRPQAAADVLYIHPAKQGVGFPSHGAAGRPPGRPYGLMPLGVPALVNVLRDAGFQVVGLNYSLERELNPAFDLRAWLHHHHLARMIMIDLHWYEHAYGAIHTARVCKEELPDTCIVVGGMTASGFAHEILEEFDDVDIIIRGDAEAPLLALAQHLRDSSSDLSDIPNLVYREGGEIRQTALDYCAATEDLDNLNYADVSFLEHADAYLVHEYIVTDVEAGRQAMAQGHPYRGRWLATARGCKYECSYCGGAKSAQMRLAGRHGIIPRSPEVVVAELQQLAAAGVHQASLSYDIAVMGEAYWRPFFSLMRKQGVEIGLYNEFFQLPDPAFIKHFARSVDMTHSCLALSPLSGSERVRRLNGKQYSDSELINILDYLNLYNVPIFVYFSLNLPGENETTVEDSIALAERITRHYPSSLLKILSSCHTMDPFSPLQQHPERYGVAAAWSTFMDFYTYCQETRLGGGDARTGQWRGFTSVADEARSVERMADAWDAARRGHEKVWWPIPPSW